MPVAHDLSDLRAALRYLRAHDSKARQMVGRMRRLAPRILSQRAVLSYVRELLSQYATLRDPAEPVTLHPLAVPFVT